MNRKQLTPEESKALFARWEAIGFTNWAPPDHPIYSEGAYTIFTGSSPAGILTAPDDGPLEEVESLAVITNIEPCEQNSLTCKIFKELKSEYLGYNHSLDADDVSSLIELNEDSENIT
jgi:hypothetical protein